MCSIVFLKHVLYSTNCPEHINDFKKRKLFVNVMSLYSYETVLTLISQEASQLAQLNSLTVGKAVSLLANVEKFKNLVYLVL